MGKCLNSFKEMTLSDDMINDEPILIMRESVMDYVRGIYMERMKRYIRRAVAIAAVCALIVGACGTCSVSAATPSPKLNVKTRIIYVGGSNLPEEDYSSDVYRLVVKNRPAKYSCSWTSSNENVATAEWVKYGKCDVTAHAPGTCTVTCDFLDKVSLTRYSLSAKIVVRKSAEAIALSGYTDEALDEGETMKLTPSFFFADGSAADSMTDSIRWMSSDEKVAAVDGNGTVTAVGNGTADITCYTVVPDDAKYDSIKYATAKKTVKVTVARSVPVGINAIKQLSLNSFVITFGSDVSNTVTKDNLVLSQNDFEESIGSIAFDKSGKSVTVTTYNELIAGVTYEVRLKDVELKNGLDGTFNATKGDPVRMELYTSVSGNRVIVNEYTAVGFRLFNEKGVDITPLDTSSTEYVNYSNNIKLSIQTGGESGVYCNDRSLFAWTEGLTFTITGEYKSLVFENNAYKEKVLCSASITAKTVTEADTVSFVGAMVTDSELKGASLDWGTDNDTLSVSDIEGYRLSARATDYKGNYIYSDDESSPLSFEFETSKAAFVGSDGTISPIAPGKDTILVKYSYNAADGTVKSSTIGAFNVKVTEARVPVKLECVQNGEVITYAGVSNRADVSETEFDVVLYDQFGKKLRMTLSDLTITPSESTAPPASVTINDDGSARVYIDANWYDFGADGSVVTHNYLIKYDNAVHGKIETGLLLYVMNPDSSLASTYMVDVYGDKDIRISSDSASLPVLRVKLYEMKGSVKNSLINLVYPSSYGVGVYGGTDTYYYRLFRIEEGRSTEVTTGTDISAIKPVCLSDTGTQLIKYPTGLYMLEVYKKEISNLGSIVDVNIASTSFVLTDNQNRVTVNQMSSSTQLPLSANSSEDDLKLVLLECFDIRIGNGTVGTTQINLVNPIKTSRAVFYRDINITESITIGGVTYALVHTVTINKAIKQK